ncbi:phosphonate C-P lyase system protein PhnH [Vibrio salinus]|uniref:phosphonate C-P lyase system protein PhnH n=1 Tax=Vibrio salinus TaxID=2899784 RepID=UPI001E3004D3|nr:phosphonate C-P lyase system protein PhnH [Vibrio salinus]MCE0495284.1 phosphonate C-P lyase system protein PhnH [Vibrio salinus]
MNMISQAFQDEVHDSQQCFRRLLKAMSEPGTIVTLDRCDGFGALMPATTQVLLTMADAMTSLWFSSQLQSDSDISDNIRFHCSAPVVMSQQEADFAVFSSRDQSEYDWLSPQFDIGDEAYPDRSATVIVEVESFYEGSELTLTGPGIRQERVVCLGGLSESLFSYLEQRQERVAFPLGVDFIFTSGRQVMCFPRTTKVEVALCTLP